MHVVLALIALFAGFAQGRPSGPATNNVVDSTPRVVGGQDATDGQFPWTLSVEYYGSLGWLHMCGGILIEPFYALTGAKCVDNRNVANLRAWAGMLYRNNTAATNAQHLAISEVTMHPDYSEFTAGIPNDIAIIKFAWEADTTQSNIALAVLPPDDTNDFVHKNCTINGWGRMDPNSESFAMTMQWVQIPVITNTDCTTLVEAIQNAVVLDTHICAMSDPPGQGACRGDSGAPLNCYPSPSDTSVTYVVGTGSWTITVEGICDPYYPSVYTRLSKYLTWIEDNTP